MLPLLFTLNAYAEPSALDQMLRDNSEVKTEERPVVLNGVRYREIKIENDTFLVKFREREDKMTPEDCRRPEETFTPYLNETQVTIYRRTRAYVQAIRMKCEEKNGQIRTNLTNEAEIGIALPEQPKDKLKNKKAGWGLTDKLWHFSAEW